MGSIGGFEQLFRDVATIRDWPLYSTLVFNLPKVVKWVEKAERISWRKNLERDEYSGWWDGNNSSDRS